MDCMSSPIPCENLSTVEASAPHPGKMFPMPGNKDAANAGQSAEVGRGTDIVLQSFRFTVFKIYMILNFCFVLCPNDLLWYLNSTPFFSSFDLKKVFGFSYRLDYEMTIEKNVFFYLTM